MPQYPFYPFENHIDLVRRDIINSVPRLTQAAMKSEARTSRVLARNGLFVLDAAGLGGFLSSAEQQAVYFNTPVYDKLLSLLPREFDRSGLMPEYAPYCSNLRRSRIRGAQNVPRLIQSKHNPWFAVMLSFSVACNLLQDANITRIEQIRPPVLQTKELAEHLRQIRGR